MAKKKVLLTGFNRNQCTRDYWKNQELQVVLAQYSLIRALEDMGWEVEQRSVQLGETLKEYDEVIIFLHNIQSFSHALYSGMYALSVRPDAILAFDDWQVHLILHSFDTLQKHMEAGTMLYTTGNHRLYKDYVMEIQLTKHTVEELQAYETAFYEGLKTVTRRTNRLLLTLFDGGDWRLIKTGWTDESRVFPFNPNAYHYRRTPENNFGTLNPMMTGVLGPVSPEDKEKRWNFASLLHNSTGKWLERQKLEWPVRLYGQRKGENKTSRITEDEMCYEYAKAWGSLIPPYNHSGSGWWRTRVLQVADAGSILLPDPREGAVYGEAYTGITADMIEGMTVDELARLAARQKECLLDKHPLDKEVVRQRITAVLEAPK